MLNKKSHSRTYQLFAQLRSSPTRSLSPVTIDTGLTYRKVMNYLDTEQRIWEGMGAKVERTRAMLQLELDGIRLRIWFQKE